jgi:type IV pilus assembly protein PilQ
VLRIFADYSGHSILSSNSVTGNVSASINDVPWDVALKAILNLNGFDAVQDDYGIITVNSFASIHQTTAETARAEPMSSRTIRFNYTGAAAIAPMLAARLSHDCPTVTTTAAATTTPVGGGSLGDQTLRRPACP